MSTLTRSICATPTTNLPCYPCVFGTPSLTDDATVTVVSIPQLPIRGRPVTNKLPCRPRAQQRRKTPSPSPSSTAAPAPHQPTLAPSRAIPPARPATDALRTAPVSLSRAQKPNLRCPRRRPRQARPPRWLIRRDARRKREAVRHPLGIRSCLLLPRPRQLIPRIGRPRLRPRLLRLRVFETVCLMVGFGFLRSWLW